MNVSDLQTRISAIRADEAAVQEALSGVQTAMEAWLVAMTGVHDLLASAASVASGEKPKPLIVSGGLVTAEDLPPPPAEKSMFSSPVRPVMAKAEPETQADPISDEEEQALMESLDAETANAIRVRRRLSGGRKSVRDLLAEIQSEKKSPDQSQKKGWWS